MTIAADPRRLGGRVGMTAVLHTWGSALTHHPHIHMIVPGGSLSPGGTRWIACRPGFFVPVQDLSPPLPRRPARPPSVGASGLLRRPCRSDRGRRIYRLAGAVPQVGMGSLCQAPVRRPRSGIGLSQPIHASRGDLEQPLGQRGCPNRRLPLEGSPHQIRRPPKDHAADHRRVHPPLPDPRPTRRVPSHPALRPTGQCRPQVQHREDPQPARGGAPRRCPRTGGRTHSAYAARAVPLLRRTDADHRNIPARAKAAIAGTASGDGSMTKRPSSRSIWHRFPCGHRTAGDCPRRPEPAETARLCLDPAIGASVTSGKSSLRAHPSRRQWLLIIMAAPDDGALSP